MSHNPIRLIKLHLELYCLPYASNHLYNGERANTLHQLVNQLATTLLIYHLIKHK